MYDDDVSAGVELTWEAPETDAESVTGYEIQRGQSDDGDPATLVADTGSTAIAYADATANEPGEAYSYRVIALRGDEQSQPSGRAWVSIPTVTVTAQPVEPFIALPQVATGFALDGGNSAPVGIWGRPPIWSSDATLAQASSGTGVGAGSGYPGSSLDNSDFHLRRRHGLHHRSPGESDHGK